MIVTPRCFSAEVLRRGFSHVHHVKCDLDQNSSTAVRHHMSVNHFLSVVFAVPRCSLPQFLRLRTHHWKLRCKPWWADMSKTHRIDHQLVILSFPIRLIFPIHSVPTFLAVFQREYPESLIGASNRVYLRKTWLRCRRVWCPSFIDLFTAVTFTDFCHFGFRLSRALVFSLRFVRLLVPTISSFVSILSAVSTLTLESRVFCCRFSVTFA